MTDELDPDLVRLRAAHAQIAGAPPSVVAAARAQLQTPEVDAAKATPTPGAPRRHRLRLPHPLIIVSAGGLAVAVLLVVSFLPSGASKRLPGGGDLGLAAAAQRSCAAPANSRRASADCLNALGAVAGDWQVPGSGEVLYQRSWWGTSARHLRTRAKDGRRRDRESGFYMITRGAEKETWVAPDGSGESLQLDEGKPQLPSLADRETWIADGRPPLSAGERGLTGAEINLGRARSRWKAGDLPPDLFPVGEIHGPDGKRALLTTGDPVREFSTDPVRLRMQIQDFAWRQRIELSGDPRCARDLSDCDPGTRRNIGSNFASIVVALLQYPAATRPLRAAVLEMLADEPGFRTIGTAADQRGRRGVAVLLPASSGSGQNILLIDTQTARLIAAGNSPNNTLRVARWMDLFNLQVERVERAGDRP